MVSNPWCFASIDGDVADLDVLFVLEDAAAVEEDGVAALGDHAGLGGSGVLPLLEADVGREGVGTGGDEVADAGEVEEALLEVVQSAVRIRNRFLTCSGFASLILWRQITVHVPRVLAATAPLRDH